MRAPVQASPSCSAFAVVGISDPVADRNEEERQWCRKSSKIETTTSYQSNFDKDQHKWLDRQCKCDFWRSFLGFKSAIFDNWKRERELGKVSAVRHPKGDLNG
ncbi:unnamed protein product [Brassica oleracea var. botrytis]|uniref:Uncharacterized protein n=1 Tax=Brassica oleracea TaxID=3712 RepID=A0A3P6FHF7_BRAOL|nr:unnamed protein product [Brassica oleracea]